MQETLRHTKKDSKSIWSISWSLANFAWLCYFTLQIRGAEKTTELIVQKIFIGLTPFLVSMLGLVIYHYIRSDLYLEKDKPILGKSLIPGKLLRMVEVWSPEPIEMLVNFHAEYNAYKSLIDYRTSYEYDSIHSQLDEFLNAFEVSGNIFFPSIKTKYSSQEEALKAFPRLKELAKEISKTIT